MNDILMMLISALGAVAGAAVILAGLASGTAIASVIAGGAAASAVVILPVVLCVGGVAYAASRTGYVTSG